MKQFNNILQYVGDIRPEDMWSAIADAQVFLTTVETIELNPFVFTDTVAELITVDNELSTLKIIERYEYNMSLIQ
jgi:hypothetical protein